MSLREVALPSGAKLRIAPAPFTEARAVYQALCVELRGVALDPKDDINANMKKDLVMMALASKPLEAAIWACMPSCLYNNTKISAATFEPVEARQDYIAVCWEVGKENVTPFTKSLYAEFRDIIEKVKSDLA